MPPKREGKALKVYFDMKNTTNNNTPALKQLSNPRTLDGSLRQHWSATIYRYYCGILWHSGDAGVCLWAVHGATELRVFTVVAFCAAWNGGGVL